jgi:hypothetical protein
METITYLGKLILTDLSGTTITGAIITGIVAGLIVNLMIKQREKKRWAEPAKHLKRELQRLTTGILTTVRSHLEIPFQPSRSAILTDDYKSIYQDIVSLFNEEIIKKFDSRYKDRLKKINSQKWHYFIASLQDTYNSITSNLSIFQNQLDPQTTQKLLNLREKIRMVMGYYSIYPDVIGVPLGQQSPVTRGSQEENSNSIHSGFFHFIKDLTIYATDTLNFLTKTQEKTK